jgi:glucokinase
MPTRMAADVGGTNTRIALFDTNTKELRALSTYKNRDYEHFADVIAAWMDTLAEPHPKEGCIAIAAVPQRDQISMTNMDWSFSRSEIAEKFKFANLSWINDFEANAFSLPHLTERDKAVIYPGNPEDSSRLVVIGPGTGLGGATIETFGQISYARACEPGQMGISPGNDLEIEIFRILLQRYSLVHGELLISGPGLLRLYETLAKITGREAEAGSPAAVSQLAMERGDETAVLALNTFAALLGSIAGDFVLANGSYGGVFLAGGIVPTMIPFLQNSDFHQRFCNKGPMSNVLHNVPVYVITTAQPGLIGAAHASGVTTGQN